MRIKKTVEYNINLYMRIRGLLSKDTRVRIY